MGHELPYAPVDSARRRRRRWWAVLGLIVLLIAGWWALPWLHGPLADWHARQRTAMFTAIPAAGIDLGTEPVYVDNVAPGPIGKFDWQRQRYEPGTPPATPPAVNSVPQAVRRLHGHHELATKVSYGTLDYLNLRPAATSGTLGDDVAVALVTPIMIGTDTTLLTVTVEPFFVVLHVGPSMDAAGSFNANQRELIRLPINRGPGETLSFLPGNYVNQTVVLPYRLDGVSGNLEIVLPTAMVNATRFSMPPTQVAAHHGRVGPSFVWNTGLPPMTISAVDAPWQSVDLPGDLMHVTTVDDGSFLLWSRPTAVFRQRLVWHLRPATRTFEFVFEHEADERDRVTDGLQPVAVGANRRSGVRDARTGERLAGDFPVFTHLLRDTVLWLNPAEPDRLQRATAKQRHAVDLPGEIDAIVGVARPAGVAVMRDNDLWLLDTDNDTDEPGEWFEFPVDLPRHLAVNVAAMIAQVEPDRWFLMFGDQLTLHGPDGRLLGDYRALGENILPSDAAGQRVLASAGRRYVVFDFATDPPTLHELPGHDDLLIPQLSEDARHVLTRSRSEPKRVWLLDLP